MKTRFWTTIALLAGLAGGAAWLMARPGGGVPLSGPALARVSRISFDIGVHTVGSLDAARSHVVSSAVRGNRGKIIHLVDDGTWVQPDQVLVRLDPSPFEEEIDRLDAEVRGLEAAVEASEQLLQWEQNRVERSLTTASYNMEVARLDRKRLEEGEGPLQMARYREEMEKAQTEFRRYRNYLEDLNALEAEGVSNPAERARAAQEAENFAENLRTARKRFESYRDFVLPSLLEAARAKEENARLTMDQTRRGGVFKVANASADLQRTRSRLESTRRELAQSRGELDKTTLRAPFAGIAILYETFRSGQKRKPRVGDAVLMNQPILYLPDVKALVVKTEVREVDLHKIALGKRAAVRVDAYPDADFSAQVSFVGALASERVEGRRGEKFFQVTLTMEGEDLRLRPGMTARISIRSRRVKDALCVPVQAVFGDGDAPYCYRYENGRYTRVAVTTARQNEDWVEIAAGLEEGQQVSLVVPGPSTLVPPAESGTGTAPGSDAG